MFTTKFFDDNTTAILECPSCKKKIRVISVHVFGTKIPTTTGLLNRIGPCKYYNYVPEYENTWLFREDPDVVCMRVTQDISPFFIGTVGGIIYSTWDDYPLRFYVTWEEEVEKTNPELIKWLCKLSYRTVACGCPTCDGSGSCIPQTRKNLDFTSANPFLAQFDGSIENYLKYII